MPFKCRRTARHFSLAAPLSALIFWLAPGHAQETGSAKPAEVLSMDVSDNDYPKAAIDAEAEGTTIVQLDVDSSGAILGCKVKKTSGSSVLDNASCVLARARSKVAAAQDETGRRIRSNISFPFTWVMPIQPSSASHLFSFRAKRAADGTVSDCTANGREGWRLGPEGCVQWEGDGRFSRLVREWEPGTPLQFQIWGWVDVLRPDVLEATPPRPGLGVIARRRMLISQDGCATLDTFGPVPTVPNFDVCDDLKSKADLLAESDRTSVGVFDAEVYVEPF